MASGQRGTRSIMKMISALLLTYLVVMVVLSVCSGLADDGVVIDLWQNALEVIPFGGAFAKLAVQIFNSVTGQGHNSAQYLNAGQVPTMLGLFRDFGIILLTTVLDKAFSNFIWVAAEGKDGKTFYNLVMKFLCGLVSVLICTALATFVLSFLVSQLAMLPNAGQIVISLLVSAISTFGLIGVLYFTMGAGLAAAALYALIGVVVPNAIKVIASYVAVLLILIFLNEKAWVYFGMVLAGWTGVILMMVGISGMIEAAFEK